MKHSYRTSTILFNLIWKALVLCKPFFSNMLSLQKYFLTWNTKLKDIQRVLTLVFSIIIKSEKSVIVRNKGVSLIMSPSTWNVHIVLPPADRRLRISVHLTAKLQPFILQDHLVYWPPLERGPFYTRTYTITHPHSDEEKRNTIHFSTSKDTKQ